MEIIDMFGVRRCKGDMLGIEVELENVRDEPDMDEYTYWAVVGDGSLRNCGVEFLTKKPAPYAKLDKIMEELDEIIQQIPDSRATVRTGLHVHVNVSDMTSDQVRCMLLLSVLIEPGMIWHCGEDRASNIYSLASSRGDGLLDKIQQCMVDDGSMHTAVRRSVDLKYAAINLGAVARLGTLEYRMHRGTKDTRDITKWVDIVMGIRRIALEFESPQQVLKGIEWLREACIGIGLSPSAITRRSERRANLLMAPVHNDSDGYRTSPYRERAEMVVDEIFVDDQEEYRRILERAARQELSEINRVLRDVRNSIHDEMTFSWTSVRRRGRVKGHVATFDVRTSITLDSPEKITRATLVQYRRLNRILS